jgi:site-specific DNA-cytosine methylase
MMRNGQVFELPMQALHTTDTESLSSPILRTPAASEGERGHQPEEKARARGGQVTLSGQFLLATPVASEGLKAPAQQNSETKGKTGQVWLSNQAKDMEQTDLLPTTRTSMKNGATQKEIDAGNPKHRIEAVTNWGKFEPAIKRWEAVLGRPAPEPTKPDGKENAHRLSSRFTEWMMGVPEGWITDVGLSRNDELKACGNGVVPQQAELALRILLEGVSFDSERGGGQTVLPTPTVMDQREGKSFRSVAVKNLKEGFNRGLNLNNVTEAGLLDWNEGDKFEVVEGKVQKIEQSDTE